ncbi:reticulocalbin-2-like isoform X2 [Acanthaster planci]|uniref:Reticulocalbin-3 n=1 Tax=Acanthaster planci TaxID=133434 RepID=A0A8B7ZN91_ACAPL|nr:reticulocalbin-2-like isoform X2 [Acanthaster planci]
MLSLLEPSLLTMKCSLVATSKAAREFKTLSPEESKARLRVILKKADTNEDGHIDREELQNWIIGSLKNIDRVIAEEHMLVQDKDKDGRLSWEEYNIHVLGFVPENDAEYPDQEIKLEVKSNKKMFMLADKNKDGFLEGEELLAFYNPNAVEDMQEVVVERLLEDFDHNGDGAVELEEFIGNYDDFDNTLPDLTGNRKEPEWVTEERDIFKYQLDKDGNGKMEGEELYLWVKPRYHITAEKEADHLIEVSDADGDGKLSADEILNKYEIFTGSKATHFGRHIRSENFPREEL